MLRVPELFELVLSRRKFLELDHFQTREEFDRVVPDNTFRMSPEFFLLVLDYFHDPSDIRAELTFNKRTSMFNHVRTTLAVPILRH